MDTTIYDLAIVNHVNTSDGPTPHEGCAGNTQTFRQRSVCFYEAVYGVVE